MSDSENDPLRGLLSEFALGPAWARSGGNKPARKSKFEAGDGDRPPRREDRNNRGQRDFRGNREGGDRRDFKGRGRHFEDRRHGGPSHADIAPAAGVKVTLNPDAQAVHLIAKEVHQVARVYPLYDIAQTLLAERARCRALFEIDEKHPAFFRGKLDESLFLTREEALAHLWNSELRGQFLEEETVETEPPGGNFQSVARCGISGEWLGPPNFHSYQTNLRRLHRERFANMPFEVFSSKVRTERGEEAVNAWLETMKHKTRWRLKTQPDTAGEEAAETEQPWIEDRAEAERTLATAAFDQAFEETRGAEVSAAVPAKHLSPSLLATLKAAGSHARKHPAILIPAVCRAIEAEHLPVFKRQGKLYTGPARPHGLAPDAVLAERPGIMVAWIRANSPAKLAGLWEAVLPEGSTAPPADYAADLFWLLQQGHILLYQDDTLVVQEIREPTPPKKAKAKKAAKPAEPTGETPTESSNEAPLSTEETPAAEDTTPIEAVSIETADAEPEPEPESSADAPTTFEEAIIADTETPVVEAEIEEKTPE
ncbi:MAG: hypothetical protein QM627_10325 [Luteolibacter sp.]